MAIHKQCGKQVYWFIKTDGGNHRPLEAFATGYYVIEGTVQDRQMTVFKEHFCDPADVEAYKDTAEQQRKLHEEYEAALKKAQIQALKKPCERCGANPGEACINLNEKKKGNIKKTRWPHEKRMEDS